jgi:P pilus assembly chaperone PapD
MRSCLRVAQSAALAIGLWVLAAPAWADLLLSELVVDLPAGDARADIELWNNGAERIYVAAIPREIIAPGKSTESARSDSDPEKLGVLVSPSRLILEPGQHRLLRIAYIAPERDRERVYRVTVKPEVGELNSSSSGLKLLVGYDVLVLVRPLQVRPHLKGLRDGDRLMLQNDGNVSVEIISGTACNPSGHACRDLPGGRIYAGTQKSVSVGSGSKVTYKLRWGSKVGAQEF